MEGRLFKESDSDSEFTAQDLQEKILDILPNIKQQHLTSFLQSIMKMGVECVSDLNYLTEEDISHTLTRIEARKFLDGLQSVGKYK